MKKLLLTVLAALCLAAGAVAQEAKSSKPFVIPELKSWTAGQGNVVPSGRIIVKDKSLKLTASLLADDYRALFGKTLTLAGGKARKGDIVLQLDKADKQKLGQEGYALRIGECIELTAAAPRGIFWGTRTLLQLSEQSGADRALPAGTAVDVPEYEVRGLCIDVARKFVPMRYLQQLVKIMAYHKMNTLQIHLNDNGFRQYFDNDWDKTQAAFRLECDTYPGLTATDGSYTKHEFVQLQKEAELLGVEIIPEIDVPAHSLAFTHYRPSLGSKEYGMDHLDLFNPEVYPFFDALFAEYLDGPEPVFRGRYVNIGTDEYSNAKKEVVEKFREFTDHYLRLVQSKGKKANAWGALTHAQGETPVTSEGVTLNMWYNGYADPLKMKELGYKLISMPDGYLYIVPAAGYYYDYLNCQFLYDKWTPAQIGNVKLDEGDPALMGGMFAVWNDHAGNGISTDDIHDRIMPALRTLSVKCWTGAKTALPYADFHAREGLLSEAPGVNESGRIAEDVRLAELPANTGITPAGDKTLEKIGFGYAVNFTVDCRPEAPGTALLTGNDGAAFYLSDPETGRLGFFRDGYLNTFNYTLPQSGRISIRIECTNEGTHLLVDGKERDNLKKKPVYALRPANRLREQKAAKWNPSVYDPASGSRMFYLSTLMMPFKQTGNYNSRVTDFHVEPLK